MQSDARSLGLAGAAVALDDLSHGGQENPAITGLADDQAASSGWCLPFAIRELATVTASGSLRRDNVGFGLGLSTLGTSLYRETVVRPVVACNLWGKAAVGLAVNACQLSIQRYGSASALGVDAGIVGSPAGCLSVGMSAHNLNRPSVGGSGEEIDQRISAGLCARVTDALRFSVQLQSQRGWPVQLRLGQEFWWHRQLALRAGFSDRPAQASFGFGLRWRSCLVDYGARTHPQLGLTHCLSAGYIIQRVFGRATVITPEKAAPKPPAVRIDLNTAAAADIDLLPGVGEKLSAAIVHLRDSTGRLERLNDLLAIKGVTYGLLEKIRPYVVQELAPVAEAIIRVDINLATAEELSALPGIGPKTAAAIAEYRREHGPFRDIEELMDVKGIGRATFEKLREQVFIGP